MTSVASDLSPALRELLERRRATRAGRIAEYALAVAAVAALYYAAGRLGLALAYLDGAVAALWPPVAVGLAALVVFGLRLWPGIAVADLLLGDFSTPLGTVLGQTVGNTIAVVVAALLLRRLTGGRVGLTRVSEVIAFVAAAVVAAGVSAAFGPASLYAGGVIPDYTRVLRTWFLSDLSGALVVTPLFLAWAHGGLAGIGRRRAVEGLLLLAALLVLLEVPSQRDVPYVVFPLLIWAALRFGPRGAATAIAIASGVTVWNTAQNAGPFVRDSTTDSLLATQLFVAIAALTSLILAAVTAERTRASEALGGAYAELDASRKRIVEAGDSERRRLERNLHDGAQQRLVSMALQLRLLGAQLDRDPVAVRTLVERLQAELDHALAELRELARGIHPAILSDRGLAAAVETLAARAPVPIRVEEMPAEPLPKPVEAAAYYLVAEAVTNVAKYADASSVTVTVRRRPRDVVVEVADDGVGGADPSGGSGLRGLADRVAALDGRFSVESPAGGGTRLHAEIPVR